MHLVASIEGDAFSNTVESIEEESIEDIRLQIVEIG